MGLSANATTFESSNTTSASEELPQLIGEGMESNPLPPDSSPVQTALKAITTPPPKHEQRNYQDILSYEDKWIGWDGPVWCNRYGRFENKAQAAEDDGYTPESAVTHQGSQYPPFQNWLDSIIV